MMTLCTTTPNSRRCATISFRPWRAVGQITLRHLFPLARHVKRARDERRACAGAKGEPRDSRAESAWATPFTRHRVEDEHPVGVPAAALRVRVLRVLRRGGDRELLGHVRVRVVVPGGPQRQRVVPAVRSREVLLFCPFTAAGASREQRAPSAPAGASHLLELRAVGAPPGRPRALVPVLLAPPACLLVVRVLRLAARDERRGGLLREGRVRVHGRQDVRPDVLDEEHEEQPSDDKDAGDGVLLVGTGARAGHGRAGALQERGSRAGAQSGRQVGTTTTAKPTLSARPSPPRAP